MLKAQHSYYQIPPLETNLRHLHQPAILHPLLVKFILISHLMFFLISGSFPWPFLISFSNLLLVLTSGCFPRPCSTILISHLHVLTTGRFPYQYFVRIRPNVPGTSWSPWLRDACCKKTWQEFLLCVIFYAIRLTFLLGQDIPRKVVKYPVQ
jgi:hypothetical protein